MSTGKKQYIVIGLGRFGLSVAKTLESNGCMVLAIDKDEKKVNLVADYVTRAICLDIMDEDAAKEIGFRNFDGVIVSIGHGLDVAISAIILAKEHGVNTVIAKAYDETQGKILTKVGADEIVYPEREIGSQLATNLALGNLFDAVGLTADYSIAEIPVPQKWVGRNLKELNLRKKYHINVIAIKRGHTLEVPPSAENNFLEEDILIVLGNNKVLSRLSSII